MAKTTEPNIESINARRQFLTEASKAVAAASLASTVLAGSPASASGKLAPSGGNPEPKASETLPPNAPKAQRLLGKVAVVTGAARGIGRAIAIDLAREGADVMGIDIAGPVSPILEVVPANRNDLALTERLVQATGRKFISVVADVRDINALEKASEQVVRELGRLDIVVANAGIQVFKPLLEMTSQHWGDILDVNLTGYFNTLRAFAPTLVKQNSGRIILVGSSQGRQGTKHAASYSASKWGVIGLMKSAAIELGPNKITVNCVIPGLVDTLLTRNPSRWREAVGERSDNPPAQVSEQAAAEASKRNYPLGVPWLQPEDISPAVCFLATDQAKLISGANYDVSAGFSTHYNA